MLADANTRARALLTPAQLRMLPVTPTLPGMPVNRPDKAGTPASGDFKVIRPDN
jgi:hypothetical protein